MDSPVKIVLFLVFSCFPLALGSALAQEPDSPAPRVVPLTVVDREGDPVLGLSAEQIRVRGVKADWELQLDDSPHRTILFFDAIGSKRAEIFVRGFLAEAAPEDEIEFRAENDGQQIVVPFTRDKSAVLAALDSLPESAESRVASAKSLSDRLRGATGAALRFGDAVILITRCGRPEPGPIDMMSQQGGPAIEDAEVRTGGLSLNKRAEFLPWFNRDVFLLLVARHAYRFIKHTYRLELQLKEPLTKKRELKVEVVDKQVKKRFSPEVFHPDILYPPSVPGN